MSNRLRAAFSARLGLCVAMLATLVFATALHAAEKPLRVLIFSGQNNHKWELTTPVLRTILLATDRFSVDVTETPGQCDAAALARYDVIVSNWNAWSPKGQKKDDWPPAMREAFLAYVRGGRGHVVVHAGGSSFFDWEDYHKLIGGTWGKGTGHGRVHIFDVKAIDADHPITRGIQPFRITDELWHNMAVQPNIKVLATAFSSKEAKGSGKDEPVAFVTDFGKGRCFNLVLGHDVTAMETPGFQALLQRGTEWAATGKVTISGAAR